MASGRSGIVRTRRGAAAQTLIEAVDHIHGKTRGARHQPREPPTRNDSIPVKRERIDSICSNILRTIKGAGAAVQRLIVGVRHTVGAFLRTASGTDVNAPGP